MFRSIMPVLAVGLLITFVVAPVSRADEGEAQNGSSAVDFGAMFEGSWQMQGRFRPVPRADWIPTRSSLVATPKVGGTIVFRDIEAPQIRFSAVDLITHDPETGAVQYIYASTASGMALIYEGVCKDGCRSIELEQVCGPIRIYGRCDSRTTMTFETDDRMVARDFQKGPDGEMYMSREVFYTREPEASGPAAP